jgi:hypothetical protein
VNLRDGNGHGHPRIAEQRLAESRAAENRAAENRVGTTAREVAEHASALSRLEIELATLELNRKAQELAVWSGVAVTAAVLAVFALGFACAAAAAGLAEVMPWWAALLVVTGGLLALAALLGLLAKSRFAHATPPVPERAIKEAQLTREAIGG